MLNPLAHALIYAALVLSLSAIAATVRRYGPGVRGLLDQMEF